MIFCTLGNVFHCDPSYSLAHSISSDAKMSKGIAVQFLSRFPVLASLRQMENQVGTAVAVCTDRKFIYNLVSKPRYWMKPDVKTLRQCLQSMYRHALQNGVKNISMPKIGSGCDKLKFEYDVMPILNDIFWGADVSIHVYYCDFVPRYVLTI